MPTTFSDLLRLALQGTGDNPSTWGQVANNQVFELIEEAISGYLTLDVSGSSNITLTTGNGVSDQARNAIIELTGFPIANINVFVPTITKKYILYASFTGTNTVTVKTTSGVGVTLNPGDKKIVFCDGIDVIDVLPELGDLAFLDTITSAGLIDSGVLTTSVFASGAITLPKMAGSNPGNMITYNVSGEAALVSAGSDGQLLQMVSVGTSTAIPQFKTVPYRLQVSRKVLTDSAAYNKPSDLMYAEIELQAAGGGKSGSNATGGGGGGGYSKKLLNSTSIPASVFVSIGKGVVAVTGQGCDFGGIFQATGGLPNSGNIGGLGGIGVGGDINIQGGAGQSYTNPALPGGGSSFYGGGAVVAGDGQDYGGGAGGYTGSPRAGGNGIAIITEYRQN